MTVPTDPDSTSRRELRAAARLFGGLAAAFVVATGTAIVVASSRTPSTAEAAMAGAVRVGAPTANTTAPTTTTTPATVPAEPSPPGTITVRLGEFLFAPQTLSVPAGRPVTFFVTNSGVVDHELVIGDAHVQDEAEAAMRSGGHGGHGNAGHHSGEIPSIYLQPGQSGELTVTFPEASELLIGCHVPGHWAAGMRGALRVG
jgi:uncharacterized cupredoxin-like copper-binding protein